MRKDEEREYQFKKLCQALTDQSFGWYQGEEANILVFKKQIVNKLLKTETVLPFVERMTFESVGSGMVKVRFDLRIDKLTDLVAEEIEEIGEILIKL